MIHAVIFDLDGLLVDSEPYWEEARREYCAALGCSWDSAAERTVKGHNSPEWAERIRRHCRLEFSSQDVIDGVVERMVTRYQHRLPLLPGAVEAVREMARRYPLAIASSSPLSLIEHVANEAGIRPQVSHLLSADDVGRGKPAPDVFLAAATRLGVPPPEIAVFEDSSAGITAARAAGAYVIAVPNPHYPPTAAALALADRVLASLTELDADSLTA